MRPLRVAAAVLLALAGLVLLAAAGGWLLARSDWAAREAAARAAAALGQPVRVEALGVGLLPAPSLELRGLAIGPDAGDGPLLSLERGLLELRWGELRSAPAVLEGLSLEGLTLRPRVDAAGRDNWAALVERVIELAGTGPAAFDLGRLVVERARVEYSDASAGRRVILSSAGLRAADVAPARAFPFDARLAGEATGQVFHASVEAMATLDPDHGRYAMESARLRGWIGGGAFGTGGAELAGSLGRAQLDTGAASAAIEDLGFDALGLRGRGSASIARLLDAPTVRFALHTESFAPRAVANAVGLSLPATADPAAIGEAQLALEGQAGPEGLRLERLEGRLDDTRFTGSAALPPAPAPLALRLSLDAVDLDRYLPPGSAQPASPGDALGALLEAVRTLDVDATIEVGRASVGGATARGLRVRVEPEARVEPP